MARKAIARTSGLVLLLAALACGRGTPPDGSGDAQGTPKGSEGSPSAPPAGSLAPQVRDSLDKALGAYEEIHEQLAADKTEGIAEASEMIAGTAQAAQAAAPEALRPRIEAMATAGAAMKTAAAGGDVAAARVAFAELSESVVALLSAEPSLTAGRFIYECPMTDHYKKWVQTAKEITNPYLGSRMLECGAPSEWKE
jgi:hypothetical protein